MLWVSFRQQGMKPLLHGKVLEVTERGLTVRCKNNCIRHPSFRSIKAVYATKQLCYEDKENNHMDWCLISPSIVTPPSIKSDLNTVMLLDSILEEIINFPRNEGNDAGLSIAESIVRKHLYDRIKSHVNVPYIASRQAEDWSEVEFVIYDPSDLSKLKVGDYIEGTESYGHTWQRMRGEVIRINEDSVEIRCDDWYDGNRANTVFLGSHQSIIKLKTKVSGWWFRKRISVEKPTELGDYMWASQFPEPFP